MTITAPAPGGVDSFLIDRTLRAQEAQFRREKAEINEQEARAREARRQEIVEFRIGSEFGAAHYLAIELSEKFGTPLAPAEHPDVRVVTHSRTLESRHGSTTFLTTVYGTVLRDTKGDYFMPRRVEVTASSPHLLVDFELTTTRFTDRNPDVDPEDIMDEGGHDPLFEPYCRSLLALEEIMQQDEDACE